MVKQQSEWKMAMYIVMKLITGIKDSEHFSIVVLWDNDKSELWITI